MEIVQMIHSAQYLAHKFVTITINMTTTDIWVKQDKENRVVTTFCPRLSLNLYGSAEGCGVGLDPGHKDGTGLSTQAELREPWYKT